VFDIVCFVLCAYCCRVLSPCFLAGLVATTCICIWVLVFLLYSYSYRTAGILPYYWHPHPTIVLAHSTVICQISSLESYNLLFDSAWILHFYSLHGSCHDVNCCAHNPCVTCCSWVFYYLVTKGCPTASTLSEPGLNSTCWMDFSLKDHCAVRQLAMGPLKVLIYSTTIRISLSVITRLSGTPQWQTVWVR
jgi:hypothetical protein